MDLKIYKEWKKELPKGAIVVAEVGENRFLVKKLGDKMVWLNNDNKVFVAQVNRFYICEHIREAQRLQWGLSAESAKVPFPAQVAV